MLFLLAAAAHAAPPSAPLIAAPVDGAVVADHLPELRLERSTDPDGDALSYTIFVEELDGTPLYQVPGAEQGPWVSHFISDPIPEDTWTCWYGVADDGAETATSDTSCFFVTTTNDPPSEPVFLVSGLVGLSTEIHVQNGVDAEERGERQQLELRDAHGALVDSVEIPTNGAGESTWTLSLQENSSYTLRARASDGLRLSDWVEVGLLASELDDPPSAPSALTPGQDASLEQTPVLVVKNATDPEGDALRYDFELLDAAGEVLEQVSGLAEGERTSEWAPSLELERGHYSWHAAATDEGGNQGPWSSQRSFWIGAPTSGADPGPKTSADTSGYAGGGGLPTACSSSGSSSGGLWLLGLIGLMGLARREP